MGQAAIHQNRDVNGLLDLIKKMMVHDTSRMYRAMLLIDIARLDFVAQGRHMPLHEYMSRFRTQLDVLKFMGGEICLHPGMVKDELEKLNAGANPSDAHQEAASHRARERFKAALFLAGSNQQRYGRLVQELANDYKKGRDMYPKSLTDAYELMLHDVR